MVRLRVARRHQVRDPGGLQRHPSVESRDQRAERGQAGNAAAALQGLQRGPGAAGRRSCGTGTARCTRLAGGKERHDPDKPLFDDNVYQRGEVLVLKPASNGTGFEADRGACGTLKYRCPAAFGVDCVGRKECHRARWVGEYGRIVRVDLEKHDRRLFTPTPWGSPSWKRGPPFRLGADLQPGRQRLRRGTTSAACGRLRLGLVTVVATALGCLRAERQGGRWLARSRCATDRGGRPTARPPRNWLPAATARLAPGLRRSAAAT